MSNLDSLIRADRKRSRLNREREERDKKLNVGEELQQDNERDREMIKEWLKQNEPSVKDHPSMGHLEQKRVFEDKLW